MFSVDDDELNVLTIEALQIILVNFLIIIERQLSEYLPGGKLNEHTEGVYGEQLRTESVTLSATNIVSERDFANLDRLQRDKPNANLITLEGMILFPNNKTLSWLNSLDSERKKYIFQSARQNAPEMLKLFQQRKETIKNKHISLLKVRKEEKVRKEKLKQLEMETLTKKIEKNDVLWVKNTDILKNRRDLTESQKIEAVKVQIKFRKKVLKMAPEEKNVLPFSSNNIQFSLNELLTNLKTLILMSPMNVYNDVDSESSAFVIKPKSERDDILKTLRDTVIKKNIL